MTEVLFFASLGGLMLTGGLFVSSVISRQDDLHKDIALIVFVFMVMFVVTSDVLLKG